MGQVGGRIDFHHPAGLVDEARGVEVRSSGVGAPIGGVRRKVPLP
jgi:hypothetical protein